MAQQNKFKFSLLTRSALKSSAAAAALMLIAGAIGLAIVVLFEQDLDKQISQSQYAAFQRSRQFTGAYADLAKFQQLNAELAKLQQLNTELEELRQLNAELEELRQFDADIAGLQQFDADIARLQQFDDSVGDSLSDENVLSTSSLPFLSEDESSALTSDTSV